MATFLVNAIQESATPEYELGTEIDFRHPTYGWQKYVYIQAKSALTVGGVVIQDTDSAPSAYAGEAAPGSSAASHMVKVLGVSQIAVTDEYYAPVLKGGKGLLKACDTGTDQVGATLGHDGTGTGANVDGVDVLGAGEEYLMIAYGLEAASGTAGDTFVGRVVLP